MKVAVVGAGAAGLCTIKRALSFECEVICYERGDKIGGTWVYTTDVGKDKHGNNVHTSMYEGLRTDIPKETMGYQDFSYEEGGPSYISSSQVLGFLNAYADEFELRCNIKFEHLVVRVRPLLNNKWEVIAKNLATETYETNCFDAIFICTGIFHTPSWPIYEGADLYEGKQIHSHDYRSPENYRNKSVVIVGAGPSGIDIMREISKTAGKVFWSHHLKQKLNFTLPENVIEKPDISRLGNNEVIFADGSSASCSIVLYCTGYKHSFPFLSVDCGVAVEENYVYPLFRHCVSINNPTLAFIGLPFVVCNNQMFDLQVMFCLQTFTGRKMLPSKQEMLEEEEAEMSGRWARGIVKRKAHVMGFGSHEEYLESLATFADVDRVKPVIVKIFNKSIHNLFENMNNFRDVRFKVIDDETFSEEKILN